MSLKINRLRKTFGKVVAVDDVDLYLETGSFLSVVGPSGCGKTTTLRMISGFERPDNGQIIINDEVVNDVPSRKRNIGIVFQNYALFPNLTVFENIEFGLKARKKSRQYINDKVNEMLDIIDLPNVSNRFPAQLSGGQQQRVALARALAIEPTMLLLDEPLSALDAKVRNSLRFEIKRIQTKLGITTLYVTHDQEEALSISDKVIVMNKGRIHQVGKPEEIYNTPSDYFVADFIGMSNIISVRVVDRTTHTISIENSTYSLEMDLPKGDECLLIVRPEDVLVSESNSKLDNMITFAGRVIGKTFLGPISRLKIECKENQILADIEKSDNSRYKIGNEVFISMEKSSVSLLKNNVSMEEKK